MATSCHGCVFRITDTLLYHKKTGTFAGIISVCDKRPKWEDIKQNMWTKCSYTQSWAVLIWCFFIFIYAIVWKHFLIYTRPAYPHLDKELYHFANIFLASNKLPLNTAKWIMGRCFVGKFVKRVTYISSEFTWMSWRLKSPSTWLFVQQIIQVSIKESKKTPH